MRIPLPENTVLKKAILKQSKSVHQYCKETGYTYELVMKLIQLRSPIWLKRHEGEYRSLCKQLALALGVSVHKLFPPEIYTADYYANRIRKKLFAETPEQRFKETETHDANSPEHRFAAKEAIYTALACLSERELRFLLRRIINGETLREIGKSERISGSRVQQIVIRATGKVKRATKKSGL